MEIDKSFVEKEMMVGKLRYFSSKINGKKPSPPGKYFLHVHVFGNKNKLYSCSMEVPVGITDKNKMDLVVSARKSLFAKYKE